MNLSLIVAMSENRAIGLDGDMPWHISDDLKRFKKLTMGHHIIMGRKTWESIGRLLPGRTTVIITRQEEYKVDGAITADSLERALEVCAEDDSPFIVGGAQIYELALPHVQTMHITRVHAEVEGDTFFPEIDWSDWNRVDAERHEPEENAKCQYAWSFEVWTK